MTSDRSKRSNRNLWFAVLAGLVVLGPAVSASAQEPETKSPERAQVPAEFDAVLRAYESAWARHDAESLANLFTEDGFVLRPGHPVVQGRGAIQEAYAGSGGPLTLRAYGHAMGDSIGYIVGGFSSSPTAADGGKFILTLRRQGGGGWLIAADMDNGN